MRPPARARERRPQPPPMATRWCAFQQMPSSPAIVGHGVAHLLNLGSDGGRGHGRSFSSTQVGERGDERWWFQRALVSVFVKPVPPPSSKQGTRLDLKEFAANQNISDPPLAGSPTCAVKHKMPHAARGRLNECRAQHAHVVQHTHSTHTRAECARDEYTALRPSDPSARRPREALENSLRGG